MKGQRTTCRFGVYTNKSIKQNHGNDCRWSKSNHYGDLQPEPMDGFLVQEEGKVVLCQMCQDKKKLLQEQIKDFDQLFIRNERIKLAQQKLQRQQQKPGQKEVFKFKPDSSCLSCNAMRQVKIVPQYELKAFKGDEDCEMGVNTFEVVNKKENKRHYLKIDYNQVEQPEDPISSSSSDEGEQEELDIIDYERQALEKEWKHQLSMKSRPKYVSNFNNKTLFKLRSPLQITQAHQKALSKPELDRTENEEYLVSELKYKKRQYFREHVDPLKQSVFIAKYGKSYKDHYARKENAREEMLQLRAWVRELETEEKHYGTKQMIEDEV